MGDIDQLTLLGGMDEEPREPAPPRAGVRWASVEAPGRLGFGPPELGLEGLGATVAVALVADPEPLRQAAGLAEVDLRHLPLGEGGPDPESLPRQLAALASDLRQGRRVVVLGPPRAAAYVCAAALVEHGLDAREAAAAVGGTRALGPGEVAALERFAFARGRGPTAPEEPLLQARGGPGAKSSPDEDPIATPDAKPPREKPVADGASEGPAKQASAPTGAPAPRSTGPSPTIDLRAIAAHPRRSRVVGAVLGAAVGDAMGHPTEFIDSFEAIRERYPPYGVTGFELWLEEGDRRFAPYTDDTQMAECVLRALLHARDKELELDAAMRDLAARFVRWSTEPLGGHRAPGNACLAGCRALAAGAAWNEAGGERAGGCGSVMRAYPFGLVFAHDLGRAERWAVAHSKLTHRDPIALAACAAMAVGMARVLRDEPLRVVLSEMVAAACRYSPSTAAMMARALDEAFTVDAPEQTLDRLRGWAAHEAIAAAVYVFARHPNDPRSAILEAANTPGDSDSLATLVGALVGGRCGLAALPPDWVRDVERGDALATLGLGL